MTAGFSEWTLGGVLVDPFVPYALAAALLCLLLRPVFRLVPTRRMFVNPALVGLSVFIVLLAALMVFS